MARVGSTLFATMMATIVLLAFSPNVSAQENKTVAVKVSAYTLTELNSDKTASGKYPKKGYIAISRDLEEKHGLKFGDKVHIKGLGIFEIQDRMSEEKRNWVDIYMTSYKKAVRFGIKNLKMLIYGRDDN